VSWVTIPGSPRDKVLVAGGLLIDAVNQLELTPEEKREFRNALSSLGVLQEALQRSEPRRKLRVLTGGGAQYERFGARAANDGGAS
jgi:hypothetical protein